MQLARLDHLVITGYIGNLIYGLWQLLTEKGRQAIDWLNEYRQTEDISFFALGKFIKLGIQTQLKRTELNMQTKAEESIQKATALATFEDGDFWRRFNFAKDLGKIRKLDPFAFERLCAQKFCKLMATKTIALDITYRNLERR